MWKAAHHHRFAELLSRALGDTSRDGQQRHRDAWSRVVLDGDDPLTSTVFERLGYLPGTLGVRILLAAARDGWGKPLVPEPVLAALPWPRLSTAGPPGPDWIWETESAWWLIEARWSRPTPSRRDFGAHYRAFALQRRQLGGEKLVVQVSVVRTGHPNGPPNRNFLDVTWDDLGEAMRDARRRSLDGPTRRILGDALAALDARAGVYLESLNAEPIAELLFSSLDVSGACRGGDDDA